MDVSTANKANNGLKSPKFTVNCPSKTPGAEKNYIYVSVCYGDISNDVMAYTLTDSINSDWLDKWGKRV